MPANQYDITKPRYSIKNPKRAMSELHYYGFEVLNDNEALFWFALGYIVEEARWNGQCFTLSAVYKLK
jgi:hypothetical protein